MGVTRGKIQLRSLRNLGLPAVMGEGLVGLGHAMGVLALAHRRAAVLGRVEQFVRQAERHRLLAAIARSLDHPAHSQCLATTGPNFNRYLVSRASNPA